MDYRTKNRIENFQKEMIMYSNLQSRNSKFTHTICIHYLFTQNASALPTAI